MTEPRGGAWEIVLVLGLIAVATYARFASTASCSELISPHVLTVWIGELWIGIYALEAVASRRPSTWFPVATMAVMVVGVDWPAASCNGMAVLLGHRAVAGGSLPGATPPRHLH